MIARLVVAMAITGFLVASAVSEATKLARLEPRAVRVIDAIRDARRIGLSSDQSEEQVYKTARGEAWRTHVHCLFLSNRNQRSLRV